MRYFAGITLATLLGLSVATAAESQATVKSVDKTANTMVVTIDGKDKTFPVSKDASFVTVSQVPGKKGKTMEKLTPIDNGLEGIKPGTKVTILTDMVDEKETVTSVKVGDGGTTPMKKKKKKKT